MFIYNPHIKSKIYILAHNPLSALFMFGGTEVIETIVTVVDKQGHLVLGFQHTCVEFVLGFFVGTPNTDVPSCYIKLPILTLYTIM